MRLGISSFVFKEPTVADGAAIHQLIEMCPPLDVNSPYAYLLLCSHYAQTCIVAYQADQADQLVGFISAYVLPTEPSTLFIWQVAVSPTVRGAGVAQQMLHHLLQRKSLKKIRYIETTVDPDNSSSRRLFKKIADHYQTTINESAFFEPKHFNTAQTEPLLRIGPLCCSIEIKGENNE